MIEPCVKHRKIIASGLFMALLVFLSPLSIQPARAQCEVPGTNGLVGHWKLDETSGTAADSAGSNNGTLSGDAAYLPSGGMINGAADFSGAGRIDIGNMDVTTGAITVLAWVYPNTFSTNDARIVSKTTGTSTANHYWAMILQNTGGSTQGITARLKAGGTTETNESSGTISTGEWSHIGFTYDPSNTANEISYFINGAHNSSDNHTTGGVLDSNGSTPVAIGNQPTGAGDRPFDGQIDDLRIYDRVLSPEEINAIYLQRSYDTPSAGQVAFNTSNAQMVYCDGTEWVMMGTGAYNPPSIKFDDSNGYLTGALTGTAPSKQMTGSLWFKFDDISPSYTMEILDSDGNGDISLNWLNGSDRMQVFARNAAGTTVLQIQANALTDTDWHHMMWSVDLSDSGKRHIYVDGVDEFYSAGVYVDDFMDFTDTNYFVGIKSDITQDFVGHMADVWIDFGTYIDLSIESNRRKFFSTNGMPMFLGKDGSLPTGYSPEIFLTGDVTDWHNNKGAAGGFTVGGGTLTAGESQPADDIGLGGTGYFVETAGTSGGDLGGISGAAATCLSRLEAGTWLGKTTASANGQISSDNVRPWLCTNTECQNLVPGGTYAYASTVNSAQGGATMTATGEGYTEHDGLYYWDATAFGAVSNFREFWTGRGQDNLPSDETCEGWTSSSGAIGSRTAVTDTAYYPEKLSKVWQECDNGGKRLVCIVDPPGCRPGGLMRYNEDYKVMEYCNGVEWVSMGPSDVNIPTDGLVGHWTFDEGSGTSADDSSSSNNDGGLNGNVSWSSDAIIGTALDYDGSGGDYVLVGHDTSIDLTGEFSIAFWMKNHDTAAAGFDVIGKINNAANRWQYSIQTIGDEISLFYCNDTNALCNFAPNTYHTLRTDTANIAEDVWVHYVITYDDTNNAIEFYFDGTQYAGTKVNLTANNAETNSIVTSSDPLRIGHSGYASSETDAILDEVMLYDKVLSQSEITQIYQYGLGGVTGYTPVDCTNPAMPPGSMFYNASTNHMQYCNGERWVGVGK